MEQMKLILDDRSIEYKVNLSNKTIYIGSKQIKFIGLNIPRSYVMLDEANLAFDVMTIDLSAEVSKLWVMSLNRLL